MSNINTYVPKITKHNYLNFSSMINGSRISEEWFDSTYELHHTHLSCKTIYQLAKAGFQLFLTNNPGVIKSGKAELLKYAVPF